MKLFPMLYFSELFNKQVATDKGKILGQLKDLFFLYAEIPALTKLAVEDKDSRKLIPVIYLKKINHSLTVAHNYETAEPAEAELSVAGNLLDRQVIDLKGDKVVRINDIIISESPNYYISGIDISVWGVLRRLGLLKPVINILRQLKITVLQEALSWGEIQNLELMQGKIQLKVKEEKLAKIRPEDLADYLQTTNIDNIKTFLSNLNLEKAAEVREVVCSVLILIVDGQQVLTVSAADEDGAYGITSTDETLVRLGLEYWDSPRCCVAC